MLHFPPTENNFFITDTPQKFNFIPTTAIEQQLLQIPIPYIAGHCSVCQDTTHLQFSPAFYTAIQQQTFVNWREDLSCECCHFNARMRATVELIQYLIAQQLPRETYISEAVTPLYHHLSTRLPKLIGSEFLGIDKVGGKVYEYLGQSVQHEDLTHLSFANESFDLILSFDVLEHVSAYHQAFNEIYRVLTKGGRFLFSVPIHLDKSKTLIRATQDTKGHITHLLPPEYHGDPVNQAGVLCFQDFGLDINLLLRKIGFRYVKFIVAQSAKKYYLGKGHIFLYVEK
ncbi:methylase involved in ubiquinone/menaquinone biosynthesis [Beggiatoa alba B18LD]|uniref:Methylase involved in ubiquinone/menaquinone biosynthesis n=1 Tax=Beggiatoa alba B18LD TaxID=395493 RepID=I3CBF6_9GAMM|nr:class I SAM-dependent methyltransferase [Beggiatoa alba]EIJ40949.1 methylase involved in ubiquinone/menaquinone biosynthesis [Beggiatoa alba B18LD]